MKSNRKPLWDLPTRLCHWLFVFLIGLSWWSAEYDHLDWHTWSGYTLLTLVIFRIIWGFVGSQASRFRSFLRGPRTFVAYSKTLFDRHTSPSLGHNPMGAWSVMILLSLMLAQILLGLFSEDVDGLASGPLSYWVSFDTGRWAAETHEELFNVLVAFIVLHIIFILFYQFYKKENLVNSMLTGVKEGVDSQSLSRSPLWLAALILCFVAGFVWWLVT